MCVNQGVILNAITSLNRNQLWTETNFGQKPTLDRNQNSQATEMQKIRTDFHKEVDSLRSEVVNQFNTNSKMDQIETKADSRFAQMMAAIAANLPAPTTVPSRPSPTANSATADPTRPQHASAFSSGAIGVNFIGAITTNVIVSCINSCSCRRISCRAHFRRSKGQLQTYASRQAESECF
jgi:hypothetical protein